MSLHPLAGKPAPYEMLVNVPRLISAYYTREPDPGDPAQRVAFGTSGHRGSSFKNLTKPTFWQSLRLSVNSVRRRVSLARCSSA